MRHATWLLVIALWAAASTALAKTETFSETTADQFAGGRSEGVVGTNLGTLRLGRALDSLLKDAEGVDYVARMAEAPDGTVYAVTGGGGRIYRLKDGKVDLFATLDDKFLFSCAVDGKGVLYVGSGGTKGRIWRVQPQGAGQPKAEILFEADDVKYIWDLVCLKDGALAAATGDHGKVLRVTQDGKSEPLITTEANHVLCLALAPDGTLYAGTDGGALVYRYADKKVFILYDADETEVTGLALDGEGNLYVGVSSGAGGRAGGAQPGGGPKPISITVPGPSRSGMSEEGAKPEGGKPKSPGEEKGKAEPPGETKHDDADKPVKAAESPALPSPPSPPPSMPPTSGRAESRGTGNGVYRITPEGLVTRVFECRDAMVLGLAVSERHLLIGTGRDAHIYEVALEAPEEEACVATVDPKQVMALAVTKGGRVVVGTAAPGRLYALSKGYAKEGTYTSRVYDAGGSAKWGTLEWRAETPGGTQLRLATRTGNVRDPEKGGWSDWSKEIAASPSRVESPAARFIQFRVTMKSGNESATAVLDQFEAAYLRVNEPPKVGGVTEAGQAAEESARAQARAADQFRQALKARNREGAPPAGPPQPPRPGHQTIRTIQWQASDPNGDELRYDVFFRTRGEPKWILLEKDLIQPTFPWDTGTVADGWYEIKVVASDRTDNPPEAALEGLKVSAPILVDNTPPVIDQVETKIGKGQVEVRFAAHDATSWLVGAAYAVDSSLEWQTVFPTDGIFDAAKKEFRFTIGDLAPGPHRLALRVADQAGNTGHADRTIIVEK